MENLDVLKFSLKNLEELLATQQKEITELKKANQRLREKLEAVRQEERRKAFKEFCSIRLRREINSLTYLADIEREYDNWAIWQGKLRMNGTSLIEDVIDNVFQKKNKDGYYCGLMLLEEEEV